MVRIAVIEGEGETKCEASCLDPSKRVLFATDFSDTAQRAFASLEKMAERGWKKVTLMHVQDSAKISKHLKERLDEFNSIDTERLEMLKEALARKGISDVDIAISYGLPFQEIVRLAKDGRHSLIVMGSQGRGFAEELFLGSTSHNVVRHAPLPVLLIPALR